MALQKAIATQYGADMTYWKITGMSMAYIPQLAVINLAGYADADASQRRLGAIPRNIRVIEDKFQQYFTAENMSTKDLREIGYNYIKENIDEFQGATDV